jgi:hypothetical protein
MDLRNVWAAARRGALLGFLWGGLAFAARADSAAVVEQLSGSASRLSAGGIVQQVTAGTTLGAGDTLTTSAGSTVVLSLGADSRKVTLASGTSVRLDSLSDGTQTRLSLLAGIMEASADALNAGARLDVRMPNGLVTAVSQDRDGFRSQAPTATREPGTRTLATSSQSSGSSFSAVYNAATGNVYNFSSASVTVTVQLKIVQSSSSQYPVGSLVSKQITLPSGYRFVMPSGFDMQDFQPSGGWGNYCNNNQFGVSQIPSGTTQKKLLNKGYLKLNDRDITLQYAAKVDRCKHVCVTFPPLVCSP